jgi:hypothetical protein
MHCVSHRCALDLSIEEISWQPLSTTSFSLLYWVVLVLYRMSPMVLVQLFGHLNVKYIRQHYKYDIVDAFTHSYCCICYIATYRYKYPTISSYVMPLAWFVSKAILKCLWPDLLSLLTNWPVAL